MSATVREAARHFGRSRRTLQRWAASGCPHEYRGRTLRFDLDQVSRWRRGGETLELIAQAVYDTWRRDAGDGLPAWRELRLPEAETLALLLIVFERIAADLGTETDPLPAPLRHCMARLVGLRQSSI